MVRSSTKPELTTTGQLQLCLALLYLLKRDECFTFSADFPQAEIQTSDPSVILVLHRLSSTVTQLPSIYGPTTGEKAEKIHKVHLVVLWGDVSVIAVVFAPPPTLRYAQNLIDGMKQKSRNMDELWLCLFFIQLTLIGPNLSTNKLRTCSSKQSVRWYRTAFICVTELWCEASLMVFELHYKTVTSVGVVHPNPAAESPLLTPLWVPCCVFTSLLYSTHQSAPTGKCNFHVCQWADVTLPMNYLLNTFNWATRPARRECNQRGMQTNRGTIKWSLICKWNFGWSSVVEDKITVSFSCTHMSWRVFWHLELRRFLGIVICFVFTVGEIQPRCCMLEADARCS